LGASSVIQSMGHTSSFGMDLRSKPPATSMPMISFTNELPGQQLWIEEILLDMWCRRLLVPVRMNRARKRASELLVAIKDVAPHPQCCERGMPNETPPRFWVCMYALCVARQQLLSLSTKSRRIVGVIQPNLSSLRQ
jgi:hypothetical protein